MADDHQRRTVGAWLRTSKRANPCPVPAMCSGRSSSANTSRHPASLVCFHKPHRRCVMVVRKQGPSHPRELRNPSPPPPVSNLGTTNELQFQCATGFLPPHRQRPGSIGPCVSSGSHSSLPGTHDWCTDATSGPLVEASIASTISQIKRLFTQYSWR
jgi:hypothetical protein